MGSHKLGDKPCGNTALSSLNLFAYKMLNPIARSQHETKGGVQMDGDVVIAERLRNMRVVEFQRFDLPRPVPASGPRILTGNLGELEGNDVWIEPTRVPLIRDEEEFLRKFSRLLHRPRPSAVGKTEAAVERLERVIHRTSES